MRRLLSVVAASSIAVLSPAALATAHATTGAAAGPSTLGIPAFTKTAVDTGALDPTRTLHLRLWLGMNDAASAAAIGTAVSTPGSASYRHYLTTQQFIDRFAPTTSDVDRAQTWATAHGFTVGSVGDGRFYLSLTGSAAIAEKAFGVALDRFTYQGHDLYAPTKAVDLPSALRGLVIGVDGLDNHQALIHPDNDFGATRTATTHPNGAPGAVFNNAKPCSTYYNDTPGTGLPSAYGVVPSYVLCGNTPTTLRAAYGTTAAIASGNDGTGQTVAIVDAYDDPTIINDVNTWSAHYGVPQLAGTQCAPQVSADASNCVSTQFRDLTPAFQAVQDDPTGDIGLPDPSGWAGEETLDAESIHSMAPGATIDYVGAATEVDLDVALLRAVTTPGVNEVSNSWGGSGDAATSDADEYQVITTIAEDTGVGIYFSSGDSGDESTGTGTNPTVDFPASDPQVTAVGGTSIAMNPDGTRGMDTGWGIAVDNLSTDGTSWSQPLPGTYQSGAGGGISSTFAQPVYQNGVVDAFSKTQRVEPDISADADAQTGLIIGQTQTQADGSVAYSEYRLGGTSLSCPLTAGIMALVSQRQGSEVGFANPAIYALEKSTPSAFYDVTSLPGPTAVARVDYNNTQDGPTHVSLRTFGQFGSLKVTPGYDDVTGVGEPDGAAFLSGLGTNAGALPGLPGTSVPEAPTPALLAIGAFAVFGGVSAVRRRRRRLAAADPKDGMVGRDPA